MDKTILKFVDLTKLNKRDKVYLDKEYLSDILKDISKGDRISYIKFGEGSIVDISSGIVTVNFNSSLKKFPFPSVFTDGFIEIIDK